MPTAAATITGGKNIGFPLPLKSGNFTLLYIIRYRTSSPGKPLRESCFSPRRVQHILDKNPIPRSRIVHQHMGHGAYQLAVLNNRTSAHALHNAPCGFHNGKITIKYEENVLFTKITIIDEGQGIAKEDLKHILDRKSVV